ncbi:MAG TPA: glucose 1-dehydrogenase [Chloroflexota bacterium]|nr:glucose 1-dehydrogenase [Chloroflexota bacterium]
MAPLDRFSLAGKKALITGASHGIGEGIALGFAEAGADVALAARSVDDLERVARLVRERGREAVVVPTDVAKLDELDRMVPRAVDGLGGLDVFVNVAGNQRRRSILDVTLDDWNFIMDVQLRAAFFGAQAAGRHMCEHGGGKIVHIASMTSYRGFLDIALYGIAKTAVVGMTRYMAVEWADRNVQVNAIAPGWIETPMTATMQPGRRKWVEDHVPQHRYGLPKDVADLAIYLASPASDYVTGQTFPVDGGFLAGNPWPRLDVG